MAAVYDVGHFDVTGVGSQVISHNLGVTPKAMILIFIGTSTVNGFTNHSTFGLALVDDDRDVFTISVSEVDGTNPSREDRGHANTIRTVADGAGTRDEGTLTAWNTATFTINWITVNQGGRWMYLAIGGEGVISNCLSVQVPATTGPESYNGMGFESELILFISAHATSMPQLQAHVIACIGATDGVNQWVVGIAGQDNISNTDTAKIQLTDSCLISHGDENITFVRAAIDSIDPDGFTLDYSIVSNGVFLTALGIAGLGGVSVGAFNKTTGAAPATNTISGLVRDPLAVLLASYQGIVSATELDHVHLGIGLGAGSNERAVTISSQHDVPVQNTERSATTAKVFQKATGFSLSAEAEADLSLGANQFQLIWDPNDGVASQILYVAFLEEEPVSDILQSSSLPQDVQSIVEVVSY